MSSIQAQTDGVLGDIFNEVKGMLGGEVEDPQAAPESKGMKKLREQIAFYTHGLDDLDKYSSELKCIYMILKLAELDSEIEARAENAALCQEQYDSYGMQLMVKASFTGIEYCYDELYEEWMARDSPGTDEYEAYEQLKNDYKEFSLKRKACEDGILSGVVPEHCMVNYSDIEQDFIETLTKYVMLLYLLNGSTMNEDNIDSYLDLVLQRLLEEYHPVPIMKKAIEIGLKMKALPCSDGRG
tara:strand:- start:2677 stop:3399 length:723 start_codon:yes stop_codon:yes gene_type:complete